MKKVLFVVSRPLEINTSASVRNKAMLEGLLANGYTVDLVTTAPDVNHAAYDQSLAVSGIRVTNVEMDAMQKLVGLGRKNKAFLWLKAVAYKWITSHEVYDHLKSIANHTDCVDLASEKYDLIISSSDPKSSHLFVYRLLAGQDFMGKWIQIWGDPFLADITQTNRNARRIRHEEQKLLRAADRVFYVSRLTWQQQRQMYPDCSEKMDYTPIPYVQEHISTLRDLQRVPCVELAYCGDYDPKVRNIKPLYDALNKSTGLHLTVCGGSSQPLSETPAVSVAGRVPYQKACAVEDAADILVFVANIRGAQIPGKIYQYAGTNKPILFILDGEAEQLRRQFDGYGRFVFADNDCESIQHAIESIIRDRKTYGPLEAFSKQAVMLELMRKV